MKYKALLFGSIGTLIESSNIQRNSFNEAFKEAGLDWYWDEQDYKILLKKSGGTKRVEDFAEKNNTNVNASQIRNRKTEIFSSFIIQNKQKLRKKCSSDFQPTNLVALLSDILFLSSHTARMRLAHSR